MTIKKGDRVRVTIEGEVTWASSDGKRFEVGHYYYFGDDRDTDTPIPAVEKIEPPVTVFKPGQVVRHRRDGDVHAITQQGWVNLTAGGLVVSRTDGYDDRFTSKYYDLVSLDTLNTEENN